ncbi:MAG TPA: hypothetical protein VG796_31390 [Verrucomicrobiales bacterium]|nr:hypothetical protein [Verrucomicrobiales bacterium]
MKWTLLFFIFPCLLPALTASAATVLLRVATTFAPGSNPNEGATNSLFSADLSDTTGLTPGLPILVTFSAPPLFGGYDLLLQTPNPTFRDTITISSVLGGVAAQTSTVFTIPNAQDFAAWPAHSFQPFSITVPWGTNLSAVPVTVSQALSVDGAGNGITLAGGASDMTITTQSVPEPSAGIFIGICSVGFLLRRRTSARTPS